MKVESIAECSPLSILQYFKPALSDNWTWKPIFALYENGRFTQVFFIFIKMAVLPFGYQLMLLCKRYIRISSLIKSAVFIRSLKIETTYGKSGSFGHQVDSDTHLQTV